MLLVREIHTPPDEEFIFPERSHTKSDKSFIRALKMSQEFNADFSVAEVVESLTRKVEESVDDE